MAAGADPLAGLRDIRFPAPTIETLLTDALIAIAAGILFALFVTFFTRLILRKRRSLREAVLAGLEATRQLKSGHRLFAQAALLKQAASEIPLLEDSSDAQAKLRSWTAKLDHWLRSDFFSKGMGVKLREALYRQEPDLDPDAVDRELVRLIRRARD